VITIGMTDVACFAAITAGVVDATMTSTLSWTNSVAISTNRPSPRRPDRHARRRKPP